MQPLNSGNIDYSKVVDQLGDLKPTDRIRVIDNQVEKISLAWLMFEKFTGFFLSCFGGTNYAEKGKVNEFLNKVITHYQNQYEHSNLKESLQQKIKEKQNDIDVLNGQLGASVAKIAMNLEEKKALKIKMNGCERTLSQNTSRIRELESEIADLTAELEVVRVQNPGKQEELAQQIQQLNQQKRDIEAELLSNTEEGSKLDGEIAELKAKIENLSKPIDLEIHERANALLKSQAKAKIAEISERIEIKLGNYNTLEASKLQIATMLAECQSKIVSLKISVLDPAEVDTRDKLVRYDEAVGSAESQTEKLSRQKRKFGEALVSILDQQKQLQAEVQKLTQRKEDLSSAANDDKTMNINREAKAQKLKEETVVELDSKVVHHQVLTETASKLNIQLAQFSDQINGTEKFMEKLRDQLSLLSARKTELEVEVTRLKLNSVEQEGILKSSNTRIGALAGSDFIREEEIKKLTGERDVLVQEDNSLSTQFNLAASNVIDKLPQRETVTKINEFLTARNLATLSEASQPRRLSAGVVSIANSQPPVSPRGSVNQYP